jgi:elongation factor P--beta-lysine ligase
LVPVHPVFMMESLARNPNLTDSQLVLALDRVDKLIQQAMQDTGMAEVFFQTNIERFADICELHGWEKALYDPAKKEWLMKKRANIDWMKLLEVKDASNNQPNL